MIDPCPVERDDLLMMSMHARRIIGQMRFAMTTEGSPRGTRVFRDVTQEANAILALLTAHLPDSAIPPLAPEE
jgi:hypothetical protein